MATHFAVIIGMILCHFHALIDAAMVNGRHGEIGVHAQRVAEEVNDIGLEIVSLSVMDKHQLIIVWVTHIRMFHAIRINAMI